MKIKNLMFAAMASMMSFAACEEPVDPNLPDELPEIYTVKLNCAGEIDVTQEPLSRFTPDNKDLYAVQVFYKPNSGGSYKYYAYGLFDDVSDLSVELLADYQYRFAIDMIDDAKDIVYCDSVLIDTNHYLGYGKPFRAYNGYNASSNLSITKLMNELVYSEEYHFDNVGGLYVSASSISSIELKDGKTCYDPKGVERYFGLVSDYTPSADGETISIFMKRIAYGLKVVAGDFLKEGTLTVSNRGRDYDNFTLTPDNKVYEAVYAYESPYSWYISQNPSTSRSIKFTWTKADGTSVSLETQSPTFNRLKQTIINIVFYEDEEAGATKLSLLYDEDPFTEGNSYTYGDEQDEYDW